MRLLLKGELPFAPVTVVYRGQSITLPETLIDTGSARTILSADVVAQINLIPEPDDILYTIRGVGGSEVVFSRKLDYLQVAERRVNDFEIEVGGMDYGFEIYGILGMDFLQYAGAILNLADMTMQFSDEGA